MRRAQAGFTLIELMVVIAIVGVLATVALGAYTDYLREARRVKVTAHFRVAVDSIKYRYGRAHTEISLGTAPTPPVPNTSAAWATLMNEDGTPAPGGGPAFAAGTGNASTGAIGLTATGTWAGADSRVTITRPAYDGLPIASMVVTQDS